MPTTYTIKLKNKSGTDRDYFLCTEVPNVHAGQRVFTTVYATAPGVADQTGTATFTCYTDYYGVCGTSPNKALGADVTVNTGDYHPVQINQGSTSLGTHLYMSGGLKPDGSGGRSAKFVNSAVKTDCTQPGGFQIDCHDFKADNGCKLGPQQLTVQKARCLTTRS
jgi:hypothetical protein